MANESRPLSWQRIRHLLNAAGVLDVGWKIASKRDGEVLAVVWYPGKKAPGKRRTEKLIKALTANGIAFREDTAATVGKLDAAAAYGIPRATV